MKWKAAWWGIEVISETSSDIDILRKLIHSLPKKPETTYDGGELEIEVGENKLNVIFNR